MNIASEGFEVYFHIIIIVLLLYLVFKVHSRDRYVHPGLAAKIAARKAAAKGASPAQQTAAAADAAQTQAVANNIASQSA